MKDMWHDAISFSLKKVEKAISLLKNSPERCLDPTAIISWKLNGVLKIETG